MNVGSVHIAQAQRLLIKSKKTWKQKMKIRFLATLTVVTSAFFVSACTPPMPPELQAQLADQYVSCEAGTFNISAPTDLTTLNSWLSEYNAICGADGSIVDQTADATVSVTSFITSDISFIPPCQVIRSVPIALDGAVPVISFADLGSVILKPSVLFKIFDGAITVWDDPLIVESNPDSTMPSSPIIVDAKVNPEVLKSFAVWMNQLELNSWPTKPKLLSEDSTARATSTLVTAPVDGTIGLYPYSFAANNALAMVSIQAAEIVDPNLDSLASGATQLKYEVPGELGAPIYDPTIPAVALQGDDKATTPWGAIFPTMMHICGVDGSTPARAFARFISRLYAQGSLVDLNLTGLGETIRSQSITVLAVGIASPQPIPSDLVIPTEPESSESATPEPSSS